VGPRRAVPATFLSFFFFFSFFPSFFFSFSFSPPPSILLNIRPQQVVRRKRAVLSSFFPRVFSLACSTRNGSPDRPAPFFFFSVFFFFFWSKIPGSRLFFFYSCRLFLSSSLSVEDWFVEDVCDIPRGITLFPFFFFLHCGPFSFLFFPEGS